MPPPNRLDPLEALRRITSRLHSLRPQAFPLHEAPPLYLAEPVVCEMKMASGTTQATRRIAVRNGFAISSSVREGDVCRVLGVLCPSPPGRSVSPKKPLDAGVSAEYAYRVDSGAAEPEGFDRFALVEDAVIVGSGLVRIERVYQGLAWVAPEPRIVFPAGTRLDQRVRATLERYRVSMVSVRPPFTVALMVVGDEILRAEARNGAEGVEDVTLGWVLAAIESLGLERLSLGVRPETAESLRDALLHLRSRADVLLLIGGVSEGVTDRTLESLLRFESQLILSGVDLDGASGLIHAKSLGMDVLAISGKPLQTASVWDLFVAPALLARLGASKDHWDWSRALYRAEPADDTTQETLRPLSVLPATRRGTADGRVGIRALSASTASPFVPAVPGQEGWLILPSQELCQRGATTGLDTRHGYFQPLSPPGRRG